MKHPLPLLLFLSLPTAAAAGDIPADTARVVDLEEVIVVSQPKEQFRLRRQPVASTVIGEGEMKRLGVRDLSEMSQYVPSFVMPRYGSRLTSSMYVRGIGSRVNSPAVGVYCDNVPLMSKAAFNSHFYMVDRADVLRGPQGTLYGQNAEGGIVRLYSKNPMSYEGTDINVGLGTGLWRTAEVAHYHRPSERLAFTAAAFYGGQDGFFDNATLGKKNDSGNEAGGKLRLLYKPGSRLTLDLGTDYQWTRQNGFAYGEFDGRGGEVQDPATTTMNTYRRQMVTTGLTASYALPGLLLTSTTSHQYLDDRMEMDQDYLPQDYLHLSQRQKMNAITEELTLRSHATTSPWQHATGLFASHQWLRTIAPVTFGNALTGRIAGAIETSMKNAMLQAMTGRFIAQGMSPAAAAAAAQQTVERMGVTMSAEMAVPETFHTPQLNLAAYHETNLLLTPRLTATLGLRIDYNRVKIDYDARAFMAMTGGTASAVATYTLSSHMADNLSKDYAQLLPKAGLTYDLGQGRGTLYATVAKGLRAGGYNIQMFSDILQSDLNNSEYQQKAQRGDYDVEHSAADYAAIDETISYKPEESWNYEAGAHLSLFSGRVLADAALFFMQIRNQQLSVMSPEYNYGRIMVNAGRSHSCGAEVALRGTVANGRLDWRATYGFTSARFDDYSETASDGTVVSYEDSRVPFVPQHTFSAAADWHEGRFTFGFNITGQGRTYWDEANTFSQKAFATLGAHADCRLGEVTLSLWGKNISDTKYNTFAVESKASGEKKFFAQRGLPFHAGLDVRIHL